MAASDWAVLMALGLLVVGGCGCAGPKQDPVLGY